MGGIQVTPYRPQSENLLDQVTKITALKNAQQESALRNQEVIAATRQNEQTQAVNSAYHDALTTDDQGNVKVDTGKLSRSLAANGHGSAVPGILKSVQDYQKSATDLQEAKGKIQSQASEAMGFLGSAIQKANYDPNLADLMIEQHLRSPNASPQEISQLQQMRMQIQQNPQMLKTLADSYVAQAPKQQEFQNSKDVANIRSQSEGKMKMAAWLRDNPTHPDGTPTDASDYQKFLNQQGIDATVAKETNPKVLKAKEDVARIEGQSRAAVELQAARGSNAALANVPKQLIAPAESAATKAGEDYAAAQAVTQRMNATMDAARRGNVVSYQIIPEEGTLQITTSQGVHRINRTEIEQYAGGGSLWQRLEGHFGKALSGKSIPDSVLNDMAEIQKIQADGAKSKYENSLKTINQNYGASFKPVEMSQGTPSGYQEGQTVTIKGKQMKVKKVYPDGSFDAQ